jgi:FkbM family methyltransferase
METFLESAYQIFADRLSRDLFSAILRFRISGDFSILPPPDTERQYFPKDIPAWKTPLRLVDCGAFDGDTLASFLQAGIPIEAAVVFEPDPRNFSSLARSVSGSLADVKEIALWPCGVFSDTTRLQFESERGEAGILTGSGDITVQCVALDDVIPSFAPTLIKMDIEGAECDALLGAQSILAKFQPGLAIATYHAPAHLWQIPLLVNQIAQTNHIKYNYYLRSHAYNSFETIFYAVPSSSGSSS